MYGLGKFLYNGYMVEKEIGARLATKKEINQLLKSSHKGALARYGLVGVLYTQTQETR